MDISLKILVNGVIVPHRALTDDERSKWLGAGTPGIHQVLLLVTPKGGDEILYRGKPDGLPLWVRWHTGHGLATICLREADEA